jgi:hypothetical protein
MQKLSILICYVFLLSISCVDSYKVPDIPYRAGILVVNGFINSAGGVTTLKLSRSSALADGGKLRSELAAKVALEGDDNTTSVFSDKGNGTYEGTFNLNQKIKYRVRIKTVGGKEYLSDFVEVKQTPSIDSVTYHANKSRNGLEIQVNAHDPNKRARNYYWEYVETWQYSAECGTASPIQTFTCWKSEISSQILFSSTARLSDDVVDHVPLTFIDANSPKQYFTYSILVKQYAVTESALDYFLELKKSTEQRGSIFDAQPASVAGNFHSLNDPEEPVIGYLCVQNVTEKRIFIRHFNLPFWFMRRPQQLECYNPNSECAGGPRECSDCRLYGGVNVKPDYWIN